MRAQRDAHSPRICQAPFPSALSVPYPPVIDPCSPRTGPAAHPGRPRRSSNRPRDRRPSQHSTQLHPRCHLQQQRAQCSAALGKQGEEYRTPCFQILSAWPRCTVMRACYRRSKQQPPGAPCCATRSASWRAAASSLKKLSTTSDTACSSTCKVWGAEVPSMVHRTAMCCKAATCWRINSSRSTVPLEALELHQRALQAAPPRTPLLPPHLARPLAAQRRKHGPGELRLLGRHVDKVGAQR